MTSKYVFMPPSSTTIHEWAKQLAAAVPEMRVVVAETPEQAAREIMDADAAFGAVSPELLDKAQRLRWLQAPAAAPPAGYYTPELIHHQVVVTNFRGIYNDHIAAHIMAYVLAFARGLHRYIPHQMQYTWNPAPDDTGVVHLPESTALIVGVGGIGGETARLLNAFGVRVLGIDARQTQVPDGIALLRGPEHLDELLPQADWVILTVPHTPATEGMIDSRRLRLMKRSAFLINIGRGMTVKLDDLVAALEQGIVGGAGLDVFEEEPLPADHPLWSAANVLITPHTAGAGPYLDERRLNILIDNAQRFVAGRPLINVVDKAQWF